MAKTAETLNYPVRIYFDSGECYHERAAIVFTLGAPAYVRAEHPNAIYPWERVQSIIRIADEAKRDAVEPNDECMLDENGMRKTAAPKTERDPLKNNGVRPESMADTYLDNERQALIDENKQLREQASRLDVVVNTHAEARRLLADDVKRLFNCVAAAAGFTGDDNSSIDDLVNHITNVTNQRNLFKKSLAIHNGRGKNMVNLVAALTEALGLSVAPDPSDEVQLKVLVGRVADLRRHRDEALDTALDLESITEQRDELRRQLEDLRAELRRSAPQEPRPLRPGGPIWVRVADTGSKRFGSIGKLEGIEYRSQDGKEMWSVNLGGIDNMRWDASAFAVIGTGRPMPKVDASDEAEDTRQVSTRDSIRTTCLSAGAKDCTVFFGPGKDDITIVVEMHGAYDLLDIKNGLYRRHGLVAGKYNLREVGKPFTETTVP